MRVNRKELQSALSLLSKIVERRQSLPILACVRVEAIGDQVQLTATDLEVGANLWLRNEAPEPTTPFCINLANLATIVKAQPKSVKEITLAVTHLEQKDKGMVVHICQVTINGIKVDALSAEDFPPVVPAPREGSRDGALPPASMPGFLEALGMVSSAISHDENRYALNGVNVVPAKGVVVATDGHRLHIGRMPAIENLAVGILPRKAVSVILAASKTALSLGAMTTPDSSCVAATFTAYLKNGVIVSRLIEGRFPNYEAVIPKAETLTTSVTVPTQTLREAIVTVSAVANERNKPVALAVNGAITLSASSQELGEAEVALAGATYEGKPVEKKLGLNARYLADVLAQVTSDSVVIQMKDELSPILVQDGNFEAIVMPMRI